jgi:hypothetical protein
MTPKLGDRLFGILRLRHHHHIRLRADNRGQAFADDRMVLDAQHANGWGLDARHFRAW